ncbi:MAG: hypothetical protein MO853_02445 [Candidatus Protistobacter heckmanni]|nr:hypothetical protein [Candidatus Protistobacter heckmanni]
MQHPHKLISRAALAALLLVSAAAINAQNAVGKAAQPTSDLDLPDLKQINRPAVATQQGGTRVERQPAFELREKTGTEIREYRDKDKPVEIDVKSGMGTSYQMSAPADSTPKIRDSDVNRVPSVKILGF